MTGTYRVVNINRGDTLNLRTGHGSNYPVVVRIRPGGRGMTLGFGRISNGPTIWQQISVSGHTGWVNEIYIEAESLGH